MKIKGWMQDYEVKIEKSTYFTNGNLAVYLLSYDEEYKCWEPYGSLTVNFEEKLPYGYAYVDTNNMPNAEAFIMEYNLGVFQGKWKTSGFCMYPLYKFN